MENVFYLKNGQKVELVEKLAKDKFLVKPFMFYQGWEGEEYEDISDDEIVVSQLFKKAPIASMEEAYKELQEKIKKSSEIYKNMLNENNSIRHDNDRLKQEKTSLENLKFDFSEFKKAKNITFFVEGRIQPFNTGSLSRYNSDRRFNLNINMRTNDSKISHSCSIYWDSESSFSDSKNVDMSYGFFFDIEEEEIIRIAKERCSKMDLSKWSSYDFHYNNKSNLKNIEKFFSQNAIDRLVELESKEKEQRKNRIIEEISMKEKEYSDLTGEKYSR